MKNTGGTKFFLLNENVPKQVKTQQNGCGKKEITDSKSAEVIYNTKWLRQSLDIPT